MGALIGLGVGVGLLLIWSSYAAPRRSGQVSRRRSRVAELLARAGLGHLSVSSFAALCGVLGVAATLLMQVVTSTPPVALVFGAMAGYLPVVAVASRARRRQRDFAEVWPEAVDNLASAVRAGLALPDALGQLSVRGPEPLRSSFAAFALDYQVTGRFGESLDRLKGRLADPVGDRVVGRLLRNLSGYLREEARTRNELESRQAWTVNGARLAVAAPWLVLLMMSFQPSVIRRYASPAGTLVLIVAAVICVVAYRLMMRIGRLPVERRILS
jgi:tight adherence protein B